MRHALWAMRYGPCAMGRCLHIVLWHCEHLAARIEHASDDGFFERSGIDLQVLRHTADGVGITDHHAVVAFAVGLECNLQVTS